MFAKIGSPNWLRLLLHDSDLLVSRFLDTRFSVLALNRAISSPALERHVGGFSSLGGGRLRTYWIGVATFIFALLAFISRRPDLWIAPQFWGEDGAIFFHAAATDGWKSWWSPYAGYLHFIPRTIACLTIEIPWEFLPLIYVWAAGFIAAGITTRVAFSALPLLPRFLGAVAIFAVPHIGEVFLNVTNVNWILAFLLVVNCLEPAPLRRVEAGRRAGEVLVAGLSGPLVLLLAPLALVFTFRTRGKPLSNVIVGAWVVAFITQAAVLLLSTRTSTFVHGQPLASLDIIIPRYVNFIFFGLWASYTPFFAWVMTILVIVALGALLLDKTNSYRGNPGLLLVLAGAILVSGRVVGDFWGNPWGFGARYTYVPIVLFLWAAAWLASGARRKSMRGLALGMFGLPIFAALSSWSAPPLPQLNWSRQVREAREGLRTTFETPPDVSFPVPPLNAATFRFSGE